MKRFIDSKRFIALVVTAVAVLALMIYAGNLGTPTTPLQQTVVTVLTPVAQLSQSVSRNFIGFFSSFATANDIAAENIELKSQLALLQNEIIMYEEQLSQIQAAQDFEAAQQNMPELNLQSAEISGRDPMGLFATFTIDLGTDDGVYEDDVVMGQFGLCGVVSVATEHYSTVRTVLSPELNISARVVGNDETGVIVGEPDISSEGLTALTLLPKTTTVAVGDLVVTSGEGGLLPPNLLIGAVKSLDVSDSGRTATAHVELFEDIHRISTVFVVGG